MKVIAVFAAVLAVSSAQIIYNSGLGYAHHGLGLGYATHGLTYSSAIAAPGVVRSVVAAPAVAVAPVATKTQYHSQDEFGQAAFGHSEPTQNHHAVRDAAGGVRGSFSYISPEGIPFTSNYIADHNGYRVASNALPVAPSVGIAGPVDTPEVTAAKIQHAAAHNDALIRAGRQKRGLVSAPIVTAAHIPARGFSYGYSAVASHPVTYAAAPAVSYAASPVTYSAVAPAVSYSAVAPAVTYAAPAVTSAVTYGAVAPAVTYSAHHVPAATVLAAPAVRAATLTKVVNTPGHAVSYRVD